MYKNVIIKKPKREGRSMKTLIIRFFALTFILSISVVFAQEEAPKLPSWNMKVNMVVTDTCGINCPCLFGLDPHHGHCRFVGGFNIVEGKFGDVPLDGVSWGILGEFTGSRANQNWLYTAYYVDKDATKVQQGALRSILSGPPFNTLGEQLGIKTEQVKIEIPDSPTGVYYLTIGDLGKMTVQPAVGNNPDVPQKIDNPVYPFPVKDIVVGTAEGKFSDHEKNLDFTAQNQGSGEIGKFELSGGGS